MRVLTVLLVLGFSSVNGWTSGSAETPAALDTTGVVEFLEGEVTIDGIEAELGQDVPPGSTVRTGANSLCEVVFRGRNIFQVQENSVAVIDLGAQSSSVELTSGGIAAVLDRLGRKGEFAIRTPAAVAGVRGTIFFVQTESPTSTFICTCNGRLSITNTPTGRADTVRARHHKGYRYRRLGDEVSRAAAGMAYHDDPQMERLAAKIGVRIDWGDGEAH
jgi:hypothetical protein